MDNDSFILITGAAKRVGRAIALHLASHGYHIAIHYNHSVDEAQSLKAQVEALGRTALLIQANLEDPAQVEAIIPTVAAKGVVAALVNNASLFGHDDIGSATLDGWNRHLAVNLTAPFILAQSYGYSTTEGRIINLLDWRTRRSDSSHLSYAVSKAALEALTRNLAVSFAPRIQVNGLALGAILPPSDGRPADQLIEAVPAQRWAKLEEVGEAVRFLLEGPSYINGEVITLDGGRHLI